MLQKRIYLANKSDIFRICEGSAIICKIYTFKAKNTVRLASWSTTYYTQFYLKYVINPFMPLKIVVFLFRMFCFLQSERIRIACRIKHFLVKRRWLFCLRIQNYFRQSIIITMKNTSWIVRLFNKYYQSDIISKG